MSRTQVTFESTQLARQRSRVSPVLQVASTPAQMQYPQKDIAPWLETLDETPPTPPPKPARTFHVSPQNSLSSMRQGSMSSYHHSNGHRPSTNLSVSTGEGSLELNDSIDDYGQALMAPELDLPPMHDVEIAPWLDRSEPQEPPSPPPKNGRSFFPPKGSFSSLRPGSSSGLFSRSRGPSESHSNLSIAETTNSAIASTSTSFMHEPRDRAFSPTPELRKSKSSMFSSLRKKVSKRNLGSNSSTLLDESEHPSLRPPPLNSASLVSFLPIPSPPQTPRFKRPKKKASQQDEVPPVPSIEPPDPGEQEIKLDTNFDEMDGIIDRAMLGNPNGRHDASSPGSDITSSKSHSDSSQFGSQFGSPLQWSDPFAPGGQLPSVFHQPRKPSRRVSPNTLLPPEPPIAPSATVLPDPGVPAEGWTAPESWSVAVKDGTDPVGEAESSSDESTGGTGRHRAS
ncbi:hypothetical protein DFH07DRAFT_909435, partial [Mycena maculata]